MRMTAGPISRNCNKQITRAGRRKADARVIFVIVVMLPLHRIDFCRRDFAPAGATKGLSDRPLETFGAHSCLLSFAESYLVSVPLFLPNKHYHIVTWEAKAKGSRGRPQTSSVFIAPLSPPQRRNPCNTKKQVSNHKIISKTEPKNRDALLTHPCFLFPRIAYSCPTALSSCVRRHLVAASPLLHSRQSA